MRAKILAVALLCVAATPTYAQTATINPVTPLNGGLPVGSTNPLPVSGSFSASLGGFHWAASLPPMTNLGTSPVAQTITAGQTIVISNIGTTNSAYCALGGTTSANATPVPAGASFSLTSISETSITCVTSASTTTLNLQTGTGLWTNAGAGASSGGGGGGAVFGPTAVGSAAANPPVLFAGTANGAATGNVQVAKVDSSGEVSISAASGAIVAGAGADGAFVTDGTKADAPATLPASTTPASGISIWKAIANALNSLLSAATTPLDNTSVPINISTSTTTQLVALSGSTQVRITSWDVIAGGTGTFQLVYGTGTACATGQNPLTGAYPLTAQAGEAKGSGIGTILKTPAGQAVCAVTVGAVQYSGSLSFQQF